MATGPANWSAGNITSPAYDAFAITPSDTGTILSGFKSLYIGGAGNVQLITYSGNVVVFTGLLAGTILPVLGQQVNATNTSATNIVGLR